MQMSGPRHDLAGVPRREQSDKSAECLAMNDFEPRVGEHYMTLVEAIRENAQRHQANGDRYMTAGKPAYAAGSYLKAQRNFERAAKLESGFSA